MLEQTIIYVLISIGVSYMWSFSEIFSSSRNLIARIPYIRRPLLCPECSSFWMGVGVWFFVYSPMLVSDSSLLSVLSCGLIVHLCASFLYKNIL